MPSQETGNDQATVAGSPASPYKIEDWSNDRCSAALQALYENTVASAAKDIHWYESKAAWMGWTARFLRRTAILLAGLGALAPLLGPTFPTFTAADGPLLAWAGNIGSANVGYIALAIAGIAVTLDNFFGYSAAWMRFRLTEADLRRRLQRFQYDWATQVSAAANQDLNSADVRQGLIKLQRDFIDKHSATIEMETKIWADRLQVNLLAFDRTNKFQRFDDLPGVAAVSIKGYESLTPESIRLTLNDHPLTVGSDGTATSDPLSPGIYNLKLRASTRDNRPVASDTKVAIRSDRSAAVEINADAGR